MPIFAMCENLLPAAFDDIGAAVLMPDPEVTTMTGFRWPSRKLRFDVGGNPSWPGGFYRFLCLTLQRCTFVCVCFSDFLLTLQGSVHSFFQLNTFPGVFFPIISTFLCFT